MEGKKKKTSKHSISASFKVGAIALAFLIIGYQAALFIHSAAVTHIASHRDAPDTVFVVNEELAARLLKESGDGRAESPERQEAPVGPLTVTHRSEHSETARETVTKFRTRKIESFPFDPNTAALDEFMRLGFSEKQAQSIINYREKGGRFRRASDFAKSYVVADSVFKRLEPFIQIPKVDLNSADSTEFDTLPGIGPYFAARMVSYREELKGYSYPEQLMDIYNFDEEKFNGLKDLITVGESAPYPLWSLDEEELKKHPYIGKYASHGIIVYRDNNPREALTVEGLAEAGVLKPDLAAKLAKCRIAEP
ncbi:MAG: helix-hairpin-helix domain-containing protein [Bacteroidia bacterium]|nr:helix-hairpin-helix domain-containing protein [Bacteroidia bacterium]